ncbi:rhodopsin kinase, partial [Reticulomyxa filosa]
MDLMAGGDLKYHLNMDKQFSEERSRFYAAEVLLGLEHIHSKGIIYRDLKLENVLLDSRGHCKISDLGLAVKMETGGVRGYAGTPGYTAPEVVLSLHYDTIADFFSFGVMIYRFLCGK